MKILVVCQYYYPEPVRITDICEELVRLGNEVTVLTGIPNYPLGEIYQGYGFKKNRKEIINGVKVYRCLTIPRKHNIFMRFLNYHSFSFFSSLYLKRIKEKYDVVFVNQLSPVMMGNAAIKYRKRTNTRVVLYCLDLWPESLCTGGITKSSLIYKLYFRISKKIYRNVDKLLVTSKSFVNYLIKKFDINENIIMYLPQYAETIFNPSDCIKKQDGKIDLMFAGNIGKAQSIETIIRAANEMKNVKNLYWHIVGDGSEYTLLKKMTYDLKLDNVIFYGRKPLNEMPELYKKADAMLVTLQADSIVSETLPGKVQTYMGAGKPIIGAINGETADVIKEARCGYCGSADDYIELANNVRKFIKIKDKNKLGKNAFNYYKNNFDKSIFIDKLNNELERGSR